jgi:glycosyl transferase family 2
MVMPRKPAITVVIPTYNWSAALRCAIRSVLLQTVQDFELFVVGDGCTDDSEAVVAEFKDPRIRWHNLERNYGSQWAANNFAVEHAAGDWIAYLGHDDIWYPRHLATILETARRASAEIVTSTMILYGPPGSGIRGVAGVFGSGRFMPRDFVPPSAFAHSKAMYGHAVKWRDPDTLALPMDAAFLDELALSGKTLAATDELTCFKFNAAWRRDCYKIKSIAEQQRMLERIETGVDFRQSELLDVIQAIAAGRFIGVAAPRAEGIEKGWFVRANRKAKGLDSRFEPSALKPIEAPTRFDMADQTMPFEWHALERNEHGTFRWSGPVTRATIDLPVVFDRDLTIRIHVLAAIAPELIDSVKLSIHGHPLQVEVDRSKGTTMLEAQARRADIVAQERDFGVTIEVAAVKRPCDVGWGSDARWLGIAVNWIELAPA